MKFTEQPADAGVRGAMADTFGGLVDSIAALDRMEAAIAAQKAKLIDDARQWSELVESSEADDSARGWSAEVRAHRVLRSELACALRIPERTAETLIADSRALLHDLPETFSALSTGRISWRHAHLMVDHASSLDAEFARGFEAAALPHASTLTAAKFDRKARMIRERMHPESIEVRHERAVDGRSLDYQPARDGMAWLNAYLPAVEAQAAYNRLTDMAMRELTPADERTLTQVRADLFTEYLLDGTLLDGRDAGIRPRVLITVPALTLLDRAAPDGHIEPAVLEGYGPIDRATACQLAAEAPSFTRLLTHPETGSVLSVGRKSYAIPADLRTWLRVRDGTCRFPGCNRAAHNCEVDHTDDWQYGGGTNHDNLAHLCAAHHHLKHQTAWAVQQLDDGVLEWTAPSGLVYLTEPEPQLAETRLAGAA